MARPIEIRPRLLYKPGPAQLALLRSRVIGIIMQLVTLFLTSFAVVRERERARWSSSSSHPSGGPGSCLGKLVPYALIGIIETLIVLCVMVFVFAVPIRGDLLLLLVLSLLFLVTALGLGLLVSTLARTQLQAIQFAFIIMLPSILLSGFVFPRQGHAGADLLDQFRDSSDVLHRNPARHHPAFGQPRRPVDARAGSAGLQLRHPDRERGTLPEAPRLGRHSSGGPVSCNQGVGR
jgi:hypothetical protein